MSAEVQYVATTPVLSGTRTADFRGIVGRGERIRTSGPCLPKALPLGLRRGLQMYAEAGVARFLAFVPSQFRPKVHPELWSTVFINGPMKDGNPRTGPDQEREGPRP